MKTSVKELLSAYLDGELTPKQRALAEKVLRQSAKAREILAKLKANSDRLKQLPRETLPKTFPQLVLTEIAHRRIRIHRPDAPTWLLRRDWRKLAVAASLMIGIGLGIAFLASNWTPPGSPDVADQPGSTANEPQKPPVHEPDQPQAPPVIVKKIDWDALRRVAPSKAEIDRALARGRGLFRPAADGLAGLLDAGTRQIAGIFDRSPADLPPPGPILTSPFSTDKKFKTIDVRLPLIVDVKDVDSPKLIDRLKDDTLHHLDFACDSAAKSLERLQHACRTAGVKLLIDPEVKQRLDRKLPVVYMIYLENTTPEQVAKIVQVLQAEDRKAEERRKGDGQFRSLMLQAIDAEGRKHVADALGVERSTLAPPKPRPKRPSPLNIDPTKPLSVETLKMLEQLAAGKGGVRMGPPKEPTAVVGVFFPNRQRVPFGKDVKHYLDTRPEWLPDAIHVLILLRPERG